MSVEMPPETKDFDIELQLFIEAVYLKFHYDFRHYARTSLRRRLRAAMLRFECPTLSRLQEKLLHEPAMFAPLLDFLTVQVSELFRDAEYFLSLRTQVVPHLRTYPSLKVWVAGCSAGEEAYSMAILLHEEGLLDRTLIYATDINPQALQQAESGIYDLERIAGFTENHRRAGGKSSLSDYYSAAYGRAIFDPQLRRRMVFSDHSLATDHVFGEMQLVSCRNVLIYFNRELQDRAVGLFHGSLCRKGFLGLGNRESLRFTALADAFTEVSRDARVYQKVSP